MDLVAKSSYCDELLVAKSSDMLSVAKSWTVELSVAKDDVRCCIHIIIASLATTGVHRCTPHLATPNQSLFKGCGLV